MVELDSKKRFFSTNQLAIIIILLTVTTVILVVLYMERTRLSTSEFTDGCSRLFGPGGSLIWDTDEVVAIWKPKSCALQYRSTSEAVSCLKNVTKVPGKPPYVHFIGDSRLQQLRDGLLFALTGYDYDGFANRKAIKDPTHSVKTLKMLGADIRFSWQAYLDSGAGPLTKLLKEISRSGRRPDVLVIGAGIWSVKDCQLKKRTQEECAIAYQKQFKTILPHLEEIAKDTDVIWMPQCAVNEKLLRGGDVGMGFTNRNMEIFNEMIKEALPKESSVTYWQSAWESSLQMNDGIDGIHLGHQTTHHLAQMLMNWMCGSTKGNSPTSIHRWNAIDDGAYCCG
ncbi:hypothetical protein BV898_16979 [Hypsibius exemplaris]|uniref:CAS1 domain-containing protein 1 n=1 Tax=Hypsibius exemplaris TaxID=2072580 RepID=A0A9X6NE65_HYPEX|nr:hypothetical protein BV898_16979 [Hypsibius exemplaris]